MPWDTGLREALVEYGPSNLPFELRPDGVLVGLMFFPYPTDKMNAGLELSPYGGLSSPTISLLTVSESRAGAMDYLNRIAGRSAPSRTLLDTIVTGNMKAQQTPTSQSVPLSVKDPERSTGDGGSGGYQQLVVEIPGDSQEIGPMYWQSGVKADGTVVYRMPLMGSTVPITIKTGRDEQVNLTIKGSRFTIRELSEVIIPPFRGEWCPLLEWNPLRPTMIPRPDPSIPTAVVGIRS